MSKSSTRSAATALVAAAALFGLDTTVSAYVLRQVRPADLFLVETSVGAVCLWAFVWVTGRYRRPARLGPHVVLGLIEPGVAYLLFDVGLPRTTAVAGGLLISTETIIGVGLAVVILRERLRPPALVALITGVIGTVLVSIGGAGHGHGQLLGDLIVLLAAMTGGTYLVVARRIPATDDALTGTAYQLLAAWAVAAGYAAATWSTDGSRLSSAGGLTVALTLSTGVLGVAIPFVLLNRSLEVVKASTAGLLLNLIPVFAVVSAVALLGEPLMAVTVGGGAAILFGLTVLGRSEGTEWSRTSPAVARSPAAPTHIGAEDVLVNLLGTGAQLQGVASVVGGESRVVRGVASGDHVDPGGAPRSSSGQPR